MICYVLRDSAKLLPQAWAGQALDPVQGTLRDFGTFSFRLQQVWEEKQGGMKEGLPR